MKRTLVLTFLICLGILVPTWANADGMLAAVTAVEESTGPVLPTATGDFVEGGTAATKGLSAGAVTGVGIGLGALQLVGGVIADRGAENLGYGIAATGELGGTVLSTYMAMTAPDVFSRIAYGMAAAGEAYSLYGTVDNWLKHDPGDGGGGSSDDSKLDIPQYNPGDTNPTGYNGIPTDTSTTDGYPSGSTENTRINGLNGTDKSPFVGNKDVAMDLYNSDPDSGFGLASLSGESGDKLGSDSSMEGATGEGGAGGISSPFGNKSGSELFANALSKYLSGMSPFDLAKLRAGDELAVADLMRALGITGDPNSIDFSMFKDLLNGMLNGESDQRYNGVLVAELITDKKTSIFDAIKKTTFLGAVQFHPKFRIALAREETKVAAGNNSSSLRGAPEGRDVAISPPLRGVETSSSLRGGAERRRGNLPDVSSMMPRKIGK